MSAPASRRRWWLAGLAVLVGLSVATGVLIGGRADTGTGRAGERPSLLQVSAGSYHTCATLERDAILCWGLDDSGQLGGGETGPVGSRKHVIGVADVEHVEVGGEHSCYLRGDGRLYCWGHNGNGQLGDATTEQRWVPTGVTRLSREIVEVTAGRYHTCALDVTGQVYCWGRNAHGQVGDGTLADRATPRPLDGLPSSRGVAAGQRHTCALLVDGRVACWGGNASGQLGDGTVTDRATPVLVPGVERASRVVAGDRHTCVLVESGEVLCWGRNSFMELGLDGPDSSSPVAVPGLGDVIDLSAGEHHTCALVDDGRAVCWGRNSSGQLGDGGIEKRLGDVGSVPVEVDLRGVTSIDAGGTHTCATTAERILYCWGYNSSTQIGDLSTETRRAPVPVELSPTDRQEPGR